VLPASQRWALFGVMIAVRNLSSFTILDFWMRQSLSVKPIGSEKFSPKSTNANGSTRIEFSCRNSDQPPLGCNRLFYNSYFRFAANRPESVAIVTGASTIPHTSCRHVNGLIHCAGWQ
jgi:hypothetical protein